MKTKISILIVILFVGVNFSYTQQNEECMVNLSFFNELAKQKKYDEAYEPWLLVRNKCPKFNRAIYVRGEKILKNKIENTTGAVQLTHIEDLLKLYDQEREHFPSKYTLGEILVNKAQLSYKHKTLLGLTDRQLYDMYDEAYLKDASNFTNPQGLYTYFSLKVDLHDAGPKKTEDTQALFDKYDDITHIIENVITKYTAKLNELEKKIDADQELSQKEKNKKRSYESYISALEEKVIPSMDKKLGDRANCEVLIPLYQKNFEANKTNALWLQRAINKMGHKECTSSPLFEQLVAQKNILEPDANTAYYLGVLNEKKGNITQSENYYAQSLKLLTDPLKKWKLLIRIGEKDRKNGSYAKARQNFREALSLNPSNKTPHLLIANMYAKSAKNCGKDNFHKRSVFWLAANEARKARGPKGTQAANSYEASAPSRSEIFEKDMAGKTINVGCWINKTVKVPTL